MKATSIQLSIFVSYFIFALLFNSTTIENISVLTQMSYDYNVSTKTANYLTIVQVLAFLIVAIFVAPFVKQFSYKKTNIALLSGTLIVSCLVPLIKSFWVAFLLFVFIGAGLAYIRLTAYHLINELNEGKKIKASLMIRLESVPLLGFSTGIVLFGMIGKALTEWYNIYWIVSILIFINLGIVFLEKQPETIIQKPTKLTLKTFFSKGIVDFIQISSHTLIQMFVISVLFLFFTDSQINNWAFEFTKNALASNANLKPQLFIAILVVSFISRWTMSYVIRYFRPFWLLSFLLIFSLFLVIVITGITWQLPKSAEVASWYHLSIEFLMIPLIIMAWSSVLPIIYSIVLANVPKNYFGSMTGFILLLSEASYLIGTFLSGYVFTVLTYKVAFFISLLSLALLTVVTVVFLTDIRKNTRKKKVEL